MSSDSLINSPEWADLETHQQDISEHSLKDLFDANIDRFSEFHQSLNGLLFDYSKTKTSSETISLLCNLAKARDVEGWRDRMFSGEAINHTENRAVLHCALRGSTAPELEVDGENVQSFVDETLSQVEVLSEKIRNNPAITDVIHIGIGGSDLGPRMVYKALAPYASGPRVYFISNVDGRALLSRLEKLNPENTALVITSKTFTTLETLTNAETAKAWFLKSLSTKELEERFFAVSTNTDAATAFGVPETHILPMRDWVGGRFSLWSAVGFPLAVTFGFERFQELLNGARAMDTHFREAPLEKNMPVLGALIGIWHRNFFHLPAKAILPYSHDLRDLPKYLQQLDMESNGKSVDRDGHNVPYATGPVIFGEAGTNSQHAFMQLLHQSEEIIPADFVVIKTSEHALEDHQIKLNANALAQAQALMNGQDNENEPHRHFTGDRPSCTLMLERLDPYHLGMLIAYYEHVVFVQGIVWGINSFDQWGVELGKVLAKPLITGFEGAEATQTLDSSTLGLLQALQQNR